MCGIFELIITSMFGSLIATANTHTTTKKTECPTSEILQISYCCYNYRSSSEFITSIAATACHCHPLEYVSKNHHKLILETLSDGVNSEKIPNTQAKSAKRERKTNS